MQSLVRELRSHKLNSAAKVEKKKKKKEKEKQDLCPIGKGWEALRAKLLVSPEPLHRGHRVSSTYGKRGEKINK